MLGLQAESDSKETKGIKRRKTLQSGRSYVRRTVVTSYCRRPCPPTPTIHTPATLLDGIEDVASCHTVRRHLAQARKMATMDSVYQLRQLYVCWSARFSRMCLYITGANYQFGGEDAGRFRKEVYRILSATSSDDGIRRR